MEDLMDTINVYQNYYLGANDLYFTVYSFWLRMFFEVAFASLTLYTIYDIVDADQDEQRFESRISNARAAYEKKKCYDKDGKSEACPVPDNTKPGADSFKPDAKNKT